jgi:hypothetical protein
LVRDAASAGIWRDGRTAAGLSEHGVGDIGPHCGSWPPGRPLGGEDHSAGRTDATPNRDPMGAPPWCFAKEGQDLRRCFRGSARQRARHFQPPCGSEPKVVLVRVATKTRGPLQSRTLLLVQVDHVGADRSLVPKQPPNGLVQRTCSADVGSVRKSNRGSSFFFSISRESGRFPSRNQTACGIFGWRGVQGSISPVAFTSTASTSVAVSARMSSRLASLHLAAIRLSVIVVASGRSPVG